MNIDLNDLKLKSRLIDFKTGPWMVRYLARDEDFLKDLMANKLLINYLSYSTESTFYDHYLIDIEEKNIPFWVEISSSDRSISLASRRLNDEIFLLESHDGISVINTSPVYLDLIEYLEKFKKAIHNDYPTDCEIIAHLKKLPLFNEDNFKEIDEKTKKLAKKIQKKVKRYIPSLFERVSDFSLKLTSQYISIRLHLLKFLSLLPSLDYDKAGLDVKKNWLESLRRFIHDETPYNQTKIPFWLKRSAQITLFISRLMFPQFLSLFIRNAVKFLAKRFIAGENIYLAKKAMRMLDSTKRQATLDQLGELVVSNLEAESYQKRVLELIRGMKDVYPRGIKNKAGIFNAHVSIKVTALGHNLKPYAYEDCYQKIAPRLRKILVEAKREQVFINVDAEHYYFRDLIFKIYSQVLLDTTELLDYEQTGIVVQAYLRDASEHLEVIEKLAQQRKIRMPIRLVKGAYFDAETIEAHVHEVRSYQFLNKEETDLHFRQMAYCILGSSHFQLTIGSHNIEDHAFCEVLRQELFPNSPMIEHQCLHMTFEALSVSLARLGYVTRNYIPIGNLIMGMAYLVRRIMENSSQVGVLSQMRNSKNEKFLLNPIEKIEAKRKDKALKRDPFLENCDSGFKPVMAERIYLDETLKKIILKHEQYGQMLPLGQTSEVLDNLRVIFSPSDPEVIIGRVKDHSANEVLKMIAIAHEEYKSSFWTENQGFGTRSLVISKVARVMLSKRDELAYLIMNEAGKTIQEAYLDVDEAIDFINFYLREEQLVLKNYSIQSLGVTGIIAPWNFPLAIAVGMSMASLIAGNAVILKPSELTPLIILKFQEILYSCGVPRNLFQVAIGSGEEVGKVLVESTDVHLVAFTGSKAVGQYIYQTSLDQFVIQPKTSNMFSKRVIAEMGGKNAIIITDTADLDEAITGVLASAFGHAGQKCSACSRIIVDKKIKDQFAQRLALAIKDLKIGSSIDFATSINPLISEKEQIRVRSVVESIKDEVIATKGVIFIDRSFEKNSGFCVGPVLVEISAQQSKHSDSWAQKEIFAPVVHLIEYSGLIEAIEIFNSTPYALTGGVFCQSQDDIDFLTHFLQAGNIYINRTCTGARVGIEPFGGFKLSGTGPKAGGKDYLHKFHISLHKKSDSDFQDFESFALKVNNEYTTPRSVGSSDTSREMLYNCGKKWIDKSQDYGFNDYTIKEFSEFYDWFKNGVKSFYDSKHFNFKIPGQRSFNDFSLIKDVGLYITNEQIPADKFLISLYTSLGMGAGVSILCLSQKSYDSILRLIEDLWQCGFSKSSINIYLASEKLIQKSILDPEIKFIYLDLPFKRYSYFSELIKQSKASHLVTLWGAWDGESYKQRNHWLKLWTLPRSYAINLMKHGAPLEVE